VTNAISRSAENPSDLQVPPITRAGVQETGWYDLGPAPGQAGPAVIVGHVDSYQAPGALFRLGALRPGDQIYFTRAGGTMARQEETDKADHRSQPEDTRRLLLSVTVHPRSRRLRPGYRRRRAAVVRLEILDR
jgi:hypothetical protein